VAAALASIQVAACAVAIAVAQAGIGWVVLAGGTAIVLGAFLIWQLERLPFIHYATSPEPRRGPSARPARLVSRRRQAQAHAERAAVERVSV
jgi:hypothetical protein